MTCKDDVGASYMPTPHQVSERAELIRRSRTDPTLRSELGLSDTRVRPEATCHLCGGSGCDPGGHRPDDFGPHVVCSACGGRGISEEDD